MMAVPDIDMFCPSNADEITKVFTRFCIAYVYWTTMRCNRWQCITQKGKEFLKFKECCLGMQFCGDECHNRFHTKTNPSTTHCHICKDFRKEGDLVTR